MHRSTAKRRRPHAGVTILACLGLAVAFAARPAMSVREGAADAAIPAIPESLSTAGRLHAAVRATSDAVAGSVTEAVPAPADELDDLLAALAGEGGLYGYSGKLRARFVAPERGMKVSAIARLFGDSAARHPGVYQPRVEAERPFALVTLVPFSQKKAGRIGSYRMGSWPFERGTARGGSYGAFDGFIRVTRENQDLAVSEHFRLRDFLTKDQRAVWPKYLVLREALLDKLELVIQELEESGTPVRHVSVMSGFRTPQYNANGGNTAGRAQNSRHQYGDAADVFVDNDRNGRLDDLNGDGRVDTRDVAVMVAAVERVERRYPDLVGGAGVYKANSAHGPFVHIDVRGSRARW